MNRHFLVASTALVVLVFVLLVQACSGNSGTTNSEASNTEIIDSAACAPTIMDGNTPKPMALMMRQMANNADSMRLKISAGQVIDSLQYPFIRFYLVEPTDPAVLQPQFFENARLFQEAYAEMFKHPEQQKDYYNAMIGKCVNCHSMYCRGPLKRINTLPLL